MRINSFLSALALLALAGGCHQPGPREAGIREIKDEDGFPLRLEMEADAESAADERVVRRRGDRYAAHRKTTAGLESIAALESDFDPFQARPPHPCPPEGSATTEKQARLNRLKNRIDIPRESDINFDITLDSLRAPGDDRERWQTTQAATIIGYVRAAKGTGKESCNCKVSDKRFTDTHIDIVAGADDDGSPLIVEITPPMRLIREHLELEPSWSSQSIKENFEGKRVRITGWMFWDTAHELEADNSDPGDQRGKANWRATAWEIHPVTSIELVDEGDF